MLGVQQRKIQWAISLLLVMLYFSGLTAQAQYGGGSGTADAPYLIYTAEQMNEIGANPVDFDKHFKLMADIDLAPYTSTDFNIIGIGYWDAFTGVFDGSGHTISNFSYIPADANNIGLFGFVGTPEKDGVITDLGMISPKVDAGTEDYVGSLVGYIYRGTITNCYAQGGKVTGNDYVGGLVGNNSQDGTITSCYATSSVSGSGTEWYQGVGGLVGYNGGAITKCYSIGRVKGLSHAAGLVGMNYVGTIADCYATGSVSGNRYAGGLVSRNYWGTITNCYSTGSVLGDERIGGLVGWNSHGIITNCYSTGNVVGNSLVGGLVGLNFAGKVTYSFWDIQTSGQSSDQGNGSSDDISGKTTAEMQMRSTFTDAGWDFLAENVNGTEDIWWILEGQNYPRLWWELIEE
ncbi:MAG: GLUG motif-containing protein [Planctomycetota bacterium]